jgi:uncharacterized membrane protein YedE/YeeE
VNFLSSDLTAAIVGGAIIGLATSMMLLANGRITGISGIVATALHLVMSPSAVQHGGPTGHHERSWRLLFILGLLIGGALIASFSQIFQNVQYPNQPIWVTALGGLLVGVGTRLGLGCTSGHGVCGISRFSLRSVLATVLFISFGILAVALMKWVL